MTIATVLHLDPHPGIGTRREGSDYVTPAPATGRLLLAERLGQRKPER